MGADLLEAVVVDQLRTMAMDEGTEGQTILETVSREEGERGGGGEGEREREGEGERGNEVLTCYFGFSEAISLPLHLFHIPIYYHLPPGLTTHTSTQHTLAHNTQHTLAHNTH